MRMPMVAAIAMCAPGILAPAASTMAPTPSARPAIQMMSDDVIGPPFDDQATPALHRALFGPAQGGCAVIPSSRGRARRLRAIASARPCARPLAVDRGGLGD